MEELDKVNGAGLDDDIQFDDDDINGLFNDNAESDDSDDINDNEDDIEISEEDLFSDNIDSSTTNKSTNSEDDIDINEDDLFGTESDTYDEQNNDTKTENTSDDDKMDMERSFNDDLDFDNISSDQNDSIEEEQNTDNKILKEYADKSLSELDDLINSLQDNNIELDDSDNSGADEHGSIVSGLDDDDDKPDTMYKNITRENEFISSTSDIVVMNPSDSGDTFRFEYIDIEKIAVPPKRIRSNGSVEDLVKSIKSTGLLKPIDVIPTNAQGIYVLIDGYRRIMACARAGRRSIPCIINTKIDVPEIPIIEAMYNHQRKYTIKEQIEYIDYLEKQKGIMSASMIEYLLQMNSGDYTKLKDILNDNDDDIVSKLMDGQFTIDQAFKKLEQRRKKESVEERELKKAARVYDEDPESGVKEIADSGELSDSDELSEDEISKLAISAGELEEVDEEDLGEMVEDGKNVPGFKPHKQDPKYRERLDPDLRKSVLARDNNTCQICKTCSGQMYVGVLDVHHIQEVYLGGTDDIDNLITACTVCHKMIHQYGRGDLYIPKKEELNSAEEEAKIKRIVKLGNIIRKGMAAKGMKLDQLKKLDRAETIGRTKPGSEQEAG